MEKNQRDGGRVDEEIEKEWWDGGIVGKWRTT